MTKRIALGADHAGFALKERLKEHFERQKTDFVDFGSYVLDKDDDYPDFAMKVASYVAVHGTKGVLVCGTGVGMCIAANKIKGVRAACVNSVHGARLARQHDDANVICIAAREADSSLAKRMITTFLRERFAGGRHQRRVNKIEFMERNSHLL